MIKIRALFLFFLAWYLSAAQAADRPHIIWIMADDLGTHDLGCYGQELIGTPHIDRLAGQGMRMTQFYAGAPVCAPSRPVLQTGLHAGHTTVRGNQCRAGGLRQPQSVRSKPASMRIGIPATDTTIGVLMQKAGYHTALIGKWHLSGYMVENTPCYRGYDEFFGTTLADPRSSRGGWMFHNDTVERIPEKYLAGSGDGIWTNIAIDFIHRKHDAPFMLLINYSTPHKPFRIADQGIYRDEPWNEMSRNYAALVSRLDRHVGMIMEALRETGLEDSTLVFFCSDNGGEYREYPEDWAEWTLTFRSNEPLRGGKADIYEGGIRVPMIVRWPGHTEPGSVSSQPLYFADAMPTFLEIAGTRVPEWCDGVSMTDILTGKKDALDDRFMYWEFEHRGFHQAVRWKDWVLLRYTIPKKRIYGQQAMDNRRRSERYPGYELYNLAQDPGQEHNVIGDYPAVASAMVKYMSTARTDSEYYPLTPEEQQNLDAMNRTRFRKYRK
jgi:arylsulfatase A-like enzyme